MYEMKKWAYHVRVEQNPIPCTRWNKNGGTMYEMSVCEYHKTALVQIDKGNKKAVSFYRPLFFWNGEVPFARINRKWRVFSIANKKYLPSNGAIHYHLS